MSAIIKAFKMRAEYVFFYVYLLLSHKSRTRNERDREGSIRPQFLTEAKAGLNGKLKISNTADNVTLGIVKCRKQTACAQTADRFEPNTVLWHSTQLYIHLVRPVFT